MLRLQVKLECKITKLHLLIFQGNYFSSDVLKKKAKFMHQMKR